MTANHKAPTDRVLVRRAHERSAYDAASSQMLRASEGAKMWAGSPKDDEEDYALQIWAGIIPVRSDVLAPVADPRNQGGLVPRDHIRDFTMA